MTSLLPTDRSAEEASRLPGTVRSGNADSMTPEDFRKDRFLRATGYNFYVWAVVNAVVTLPLFGALAGRPWPAWAAIGYPIALVVGGLVVCGLNDARVGKLCGDPRDPAA